MSSNMFLKNKSKNNKNKQYSRNENNYMQNNFSQKQKKQEQETLNINLNDFPELGRKESKESKKEESKWKQAITKEKEREKQTINVNDPKYWRGHIWTGPVMMKTQKLSKEWNDYIKKAQEGHAATIIFPYRKTQYSRDNKNWYNSLEETFTPEQLENSRIQKEREEEEEFLDKVNKSLNKLYEKKLLESEIYYNETGCLDDFALAEIEREKYEKYAAKFEDNYEEDLEQDIDKNYQEGLDEEYDDDYN